MQRCRVALYLPTRCRVPSSAHDLPRLSPVGTKPDAHRIGSRAPLGLALRAAELQVCIPMVCPIPQTAGRTLPAYPFPLAGRLSVSLHTLVHGRLTVGVKRQGLVQGLCVIKIGFTRVNLKCELAVSWACQVDKTIDFVCRVNIRGAPRGVMSKVVTRPLTSNAALRSF